MRGMGLLQKPKGAGPSSLRGERSIEPISGEDHFSVRWREMRSRWPPGRSVPDALCSDKGAGEGEKVGPDHNSGGNRGGAREENGECRFSPSAEGCSRFAVVVLLYLPCAWFAAIEKRRRDWWLSYL